MISHSLAEDGLTGRVIRATAEAFLSEGHEVLFFAEEDAASLLEAEAQQADERGAELERLAPLRRAEAEAAEQAARQAQALFEQAEAARRTAAPDLSPEEAERQSWIDAHRAISQRAMKLQKQPRRSRDADKERKPLLQPLIGLIGRMRASYADPLLLQAETMRAAADDALRAAAEAENAAIQARHEAANLREQARQARFYDTLLPQGARACAVQLSPVQGQKLEAQRLYNRPVEHELTELLREELPDLALVYRVIGSLSMSVFAALQSFHIPAFAVVTDHSLFCPAGSMIRGGAPCRLCAKGDPSACARYRCIGDQLRPSLREAQLYREMRRLGDFDAPDAYLAPSAYHQQMLLQSGLTRRPVVQVDLPVPMPQAGLLRRGKNLLCIAHMTETQGHAMLLQAAAMQAHPEPLYLVGDGPDFAVLREESFRLGLGHRVHFLGRLHAKALQGYLDEAGAVIAAPHGDEIGPWAMLQAQRMGKPVIVPPRGVLTDRVTDGESGLVAETDSPEALAQAMDRMDDMDDAAYAALSESTAEEAEKRYDPRAYIRRIIALIDES